MTEPIPHEPDFWPSRQALKAPADFLPRLREAGATAKLLTADISPRSRGELRHHDTPTDLIQDFVQSAYDGGCVVSFDWSHWSATPKGRAIVHDPREIDRTTPEELIRVVTAHVRADRFNEGSLEGAFKNGILLAVAQRANTLLRSHIYRPTTANLREGRSPKWLERVSEGSENPPPYPDILKNSLFYPASGIDGTLVKHMSHHVGSFVYCDYGIGQQRLHREIEEQGFHGYRVLFRKELNPYDVGLSQWPTPFGLPGFDDFMKPPFADWFVFERRAGFDDKHGAHRFSLLYLGTEAVATYLGMYIRNGIVPKVLAIVQPGNDGGPGYTDLRGPRELFSHAVRQQEIPQFLVSGGIGSGYTESFWPTDYPYEVLRFEHPTGTGVWSRFPVR